MCGSIQPHTFLHARTHKALLNAVLTDDTRADTMHCINMRQFLVHVFGLECMDISTTTLRSHAVVCRSGMKVDPYNYVRGQFVYQ